jgi:hypothetical protein
MKHLIDDVRRAIKARAWHASLGLALALPDVCGYLETPGEKSRCRYARWFKQNLENEFTYDNRYEPPFPVPDIGRAASPFHIPAFESVVRHVFLSGDDCYALRCAYLHLGDFDIREQRAHDVVSRFVFVEPPGGAIIHLNRYPDGMLQLQVDLFCETLCGAVERWLTSPMATNADVAARIRALPQVLVGPHIVIA